MQINPIAKSSGQHLVPVKGCWVKQMVPSGLEREGVVMATTGHGENAMVTVQWRDSQDTSTVKLAMLRCGLRIAMEVQDIPHSRVRKSLGEGIILKLRKLGEREQALVDFPVRGRQVWLPYENLRQIKGARHRYVVGVPDNHPDSAEHFRLKSLAHALEMWNENTGALSSLEIDPLPHQIHLVHHILASGNLNWMIADDVGLGKTIETGMLLSALRQRGVLRRVLLVTPAGLTRQWQEELNSKFKMGEFQIYGEDFSINEPRHWKMFDHVIASMDRLKDDAHLLSLRKAGNWDIIIFDEAHRLSRRQYGMKLTASQRFQLAAQLRQFTDAMILLTATPHQGMQDKFQALLELLHPERKAEINTLMLNPEIIGDMVFRNNKADVTDVDGNFIFKGKTTRAVKVQVSEDTLTFDKKLQEYLRQGYSASARLGNKGNAIGFVMTVYRKLASSSLAAIHHALVNRAKRLDSQLQQELRLLSENADDRFFGEWEESLATQAREFFEGEKALLEQLISEADQLMADDRKLKLFMTELLGTIQAKNPQEKVLIFTEYRTTQQYLKTALEQQFGIGCVGLIHGSMPHSERYEAIRQFEDEGRFLISTEAGGEGINLQRQCHIMVNYDLPWNPMRLVQRIGRLYRYGQKKPVVVFNVHSPDTVDEQIISLLYSRIETVVRDMAGVSSEFHERLQDDIVGEIADLLDVEAILQEATLVGIERTQERIDDALKKAREATEIQRHLFECAATFNPDETKHALQISGDHVESFVRGMFVQLGIDIVETSYGGNLWHIRLPEKVQAKLGLPKQRYEVTLNRQLASTRKGTLMLDMDSFILQHLINVAKSYDFGGQAAILQSDVFNGDVVLAGFLRWQNDQGERMRQEYTVFQVGEAGKNATNPDAFSQWLKQPATTGNTRISPQQNQERLKLAEQLANDRLAMQSNLYLHPENMQWVAAAWTTPN